MERRSIGPPLCDIQDRRRLAQRAARGNPDFVLAVKLDQDRGKKQPLAWYFCRMQDTEGGAGSIWNNNHL
jgi:hypothetical protein